LEQTSYVEIDEALNTYGEPSYDYNDEIEPNFYIPIEELQLSVRAYNYLKRAELNSVANLLYFFYDPFKNGSESENFKANLAKEVNEALQQYLGITLPSKYLEEQSEYLED
jgi:DNA-directed RNA polymerase subunit alpha